VTRAAKISGLVISSVVVGVCGSYEWRWQTRRATVKASADSFLQSFRQGADPSQDNFRIPAGRALEDLRPRFREPYRVYAREDSDRIWHVTYCSATGIEVLVGIYEGPPTGLAWFEVQSVEDEQNPHNDCR
jgi:hypothetical protein